MNDTRQIAQKLDLDAVDTGGDADYEATTIDE